MSTQKSVWLPSPTQIETAQVSKFVKLLNQKHDLHLNGFHELYDFSITQPHIFWSDFFDFSEIKIKTRGKEVLADSGKMLGSRWFADTTLNFAENLLAAAQNTPDKNALIFWCEDKIKQELSYAELLTQVNALQHTFNDSGLQPGQRVAAVVANCPQTIVSMLATAAEGAVWSSCSPDFGVQGILDRFQPIEPTILVATSGYFFKGKYIDLTEKIESLVAALPTLKTVLIYSLLPAKKLPRLNKPVLHFDEIIRLNRSASPREFQAFPFNQPLYIMFSSGTTGKPKCIVHGAGGTLIEHLKEHKLHCNIAANDNIFYNSTCGWMMWNWLVSALAVGSTVVLYDGFPLLNDGKILFDLAEQKQISIFGTSAGFLSALSKAGLTPAKTHNLSLIKTILSTGSVLAPEQFDYVYQSISATAQLCSVSGGTDIIGCFALGSPTLPVYRGQLQSRSLGYAVDVVDHSGQSICNQPGELVCRKPFPSMPLGFWNDPADELYKKAYFSRFENIWCHGDYAEITQQQGVIIYGRSDATLNPGGVRIGTAEIYAQLENLPEIVLALATGLIKNFEEEIILFVKLAEKITLDQNLIDKIKLQLRDNASPRHVPKHIIQVADIPVTRNGKVSEITVKRIINGHPVDNIDALANPECLAIYRKIVI